MTNDTTEEQQITSAQAYKRILADVNMVELEKICKQLYLSLAAAEQAYKAFKAEMLPMKSELVEEVECSDDFYSLSAWLKHADKNSYHTPNIDFETVTKFLQFVHLAGLSVSKVTGIK
mgnify:CR=1 FL=1|tara:strand:- start:33 stop:386 length:354 start_codon:yes stop_codon:yes gene_type:complete